MKVKFSHSNELLNYKLLFGMLNLTNSVVSHVLKFSVCNSTTYIYASLLVIFIKLNVNKFNMMVLLGRFTPTITHS